MWVDAGDRPTRAGGQAVTLVKLRCSSLERALHCAGSTVLPSAGRTTDESSRGTDRHARLAKGEGERIVRSLPLPFGNFTVTAIEQAFENDYLTGHPDLVGETDDAIVVVDFKGPGDVTDAKDNAQLKGYALLVQPHLMHATAWGVIIHVDDDLAVLSWDAAFYSEADLDAFEGSVIGLQAAREETTGGGHLALHMGEWCRRCDSFAFCPAQTNLVKDLAKVQRDAAPLTPETAARAWAKLKAYKTLLETIDDALRDYAAEHPVDLGKGKVLGPIEVPREEVLPDIALEVLTEAYGREKVEGLAELKLTKGAIEKTLGKEAIVLLRQRGACKTTLSVCVKEHGQ
jgi:hypothetical protein